MSEDRDRKTYIGGTDVSAILGLNPYKSPLQVFLEKTGNLQPQADNPAMKWGRILEAPVAEEFARLRNVQLKPGGFITVKDRPYLGAHPDRLFADNSALLEVKTAGVRSAVRWGQDGSPEIPVEYLTQVHWYLLVAQIPLAYVAVLIGGSDYREYEVKADREVEGSMQAAAEKFWTDHVLTGREPAIDGEASTAEYLSRKFKVNDDQVRVATIEEAGLLDGYRQLLEHMEALESQKGLYENQIKNAIGPQKGIVGPSGKVTWAWQPGKRQTDWEALAQKLGATPEQVAEATKAGNPYRVFRRLWKK